MTNQEIEEFEEQEKVEGRRKELSDRELADINGARSVAEEALLAFPQLSELNLQENESKLEHIKDFFVDMLGLRDRDKMYDLIPKMLIQAEAVTERRLNAVDKLLYLILLEKARSETQ